jgi:methylenetetrahydrofolate dehydrogenase (NADP+)/methenyltetrahydrofolate cyclohydrolase
VSAEAGTGVQWLDGEAVAAEIKADLAHRVARLAAAGVRPGLGTILVGDDAPTARYVAMKHTECEQLGLASAHVHLPADAGQAQVEAAVERFNADAAIHAFLLQYPFPAGLDYAAALLRVDPDKDVDGLHPVNLGKLLLGERAPRPCTPVGIQRLLTHYGVEVAGRHVVVVGRGLTLGRPLAALLSLKEPGANAAVTVVHTGVADLGAYTRQAEVLVAAAGSPGIVTRDMVTPGAVVVGAGTSFAGRKLLSDVAEDVAEVASWMTPRLGGVGPMTRAMLLVNCVEAAERAVAGAVG